MNTTDELSNAAIARHIEEKAFRVSVDQIPYCEDCVSKMSTGEEVAVVAHTPPVDSVADSTSVDRQFGTKIVFCSAHHSEAEDLFEKKQEQGLYADTDLILFTSRFVEKQEQLYFDNVAIKERKKPESWM